MNANFLSLGIAGHCIHGVFTGSVMCYNRSMTVVEKFRSDTIRTIKHERADNNGRYDAERACNAVQNLFERTAAAPGNLARAIAFYWRDEYIDHSPDAQNEPTEEHIDKLCAFLSFITDSDEDEEILSVGDLQELSDAIDDEAETMPLEQLQTLMSKLVERGAL